METREYFEKVMQDYNQNRNGRSLRNILSSLRWKAAKPSGKDEAVDYNWLMEFKKTYSASKPQTQQPVQSFISLSLEEGTPKKVTWEVKLLISLSDTQTSRSLSYWFERIRACSLR